MKRVLFVFIAMFCFAGIARAGENLEFSEILENEGLAAGVAWLQLQNPDAQNQFLLGGVQALRSIEHILQVRFDNYSGELPFVPGGQSILRANPNAIFDPAFVENAMKGALERLLQSGEYLKGAVGQDFAVNVDLSKIWFDIDRNGQRGSDESLMGMLGMLPGIGSVDSKIPVVRFDTADADWLAAYVHVLAGMAEMVLAIDPTPAIATVTRGRELLEQAGKIVPDPFFGRDGENLIDSIAVVLTALRGVPDKTRTRAALEHFRAMISHNKEFWRLVMLESDNEGEWLPNPAQTSAFGVVVDLKTAKAWQSVLRELSDVLEGRALLPYWRVMSRDGEGEVGINLARLLRDPGDFDIILMLHGTAIAPFLEQGRIVDQEVWREFSQLTGRRWQLFSLWFN